MKREVRDLKVGIYPGDNENCYLQIYRTDEGIHILNIDMIEEAIHHWIVDDSGASLTIESIFANPDVKSIDQ